MEWWWSSLSSSSSSSCAFLFPFSSFSPSSPSSASLSHPSQFHVCSAFPRSKSHSHSKSKPFKPSKPPPPPPAPAPSNAPKTKTKTESGEASRITRPKHWKAGEFPALSFSEFPSSGSGEDPNSKNTKTTKPTMIKNIRKKLLQRHRSTAWACTITEALSDSIRLCDPLRSLQLFRMLRHQPFYQPKEPTYMKLLLLLGRSGHPHMARHLFDEMLHEGLPPTPALYTALLAAYSRNNLLDDAFQLLHTMKASPLCQPDVYTYSTLLKACADAARFDLVDSLYQEMAHRSITPNTVTQNTVLSGYGKAGKFDDMERVLSGMLQSTNCKPDVWTMNIILSLFGNVGQIENMEKWYEKFRNYGIEPETRTFSILIGAYGKKKMYDKMSAVMEYMRKLNVPWTSSTYNNIIEAFADVGDAKNMEYSFNQMRAEGMKPDTKTFCCLINGYSNAGLFHKVVSTIQFAERNEARANTAFHNAVLSACARAGDLLEMERVYKHMKEKGCVPDEKTYTILIEAYRKEGMNDKIFELEQSDLTRLAALPVHS
ncbi:Pentatricopeptide repeat-containing protein [Rhynchospora pubera]|uniref:Pentatricopeptide repeat-containing protein n=1 Tax=Rhynchospora pubera TaxID=906938 RepID=A0AAV8DZK0_9POAL|nr:Pentatricopeptide repeat-containing protein [Rhynchospora pubera]